METLIWIIIGSFGTIFILVTIGKNSQEQTKCIICGKISNGHEQCQVCELVIDMYRPIVNSFFENDTEYQHYSPAMKTGMLVSMGVKCSNCENLRYDHLVESYECIVDGHLITRDAVCELWSKKRQ